MKKATLWEPVLFFAGLAVTGLILTLNSRELVIADFGSGWFTGAVFFPLYYLIIIANPSNKNTLRVSLWATAGTLLALSIADYMYSQEIAYHVAYVLGGWLCTLSAYGLMKRRRRKTKSFFLTRN